MNLHEWITERVDQVEAQNRPIVLVPDGGKPIVGTLTDAVRTDDGMHATFTPGPADAAVLRRCEADRRILARHRMDTTSSSWLDAVSCHGCGVAGQCDDPVTDNINDCPELLDLAHAHGITEEQLAALDRPEPQRPVSGPVTPFYGLTVTQPITPDQVPAALRGARWRSRRHH